MSVKKVGDKLAKQEDKGYVWLAGEIKGLIESGQILAGERLPTTRQLGDKYDVSRETARRAVRKIEAEGLLNVDSRRCKRIKASANDPDRGLPIAFVVGDAEKADLWDEFHRTLFACLQKAAADRGWSMLAVGTGGRSGLKVMDQLRDCRVSGMVLDAHNSEQIAAAVHAGMPVVMMDAWEPEMRLDAVVQDSFQGGLLAARHLISRGHKNIGWIGKIAESVQAQERFGGVAAALAAAGLKARPEFMMDTPWPQTAQAAREMLASSDRPTGVVGLWFDAAVELSQAAAELGLVPGKDVDIVGWSAEEQYDSAYRFRFNGAALPPTVVWSVSELARLTVSRLAERRANPGQAPTLTKIPAKLRL